MSEFDVLPGFKNFVLLFGLKTGENELGPPQLHYRNLAVNTSEPNLRHSAGFGNDLIPSLLSLAHWTRLRVWVQVRGIEQQRQGNAVVDSAEYNLPQIQIRC